MNNSLYQYTWGIAHYLRWVWMTTNQMS